MKKALALNLLLLVMVVIGARYELVFAPYLLIVWIIAFVILHNSINPKTYPIYIFGISLGLLWQSSLLGVHVIGSDATLEYFLSNQVIKFGQSAAEYHQYSVSMVVTYLAPFLARIFGLLNVYKIIFPMFLASVPVIMYFVYQKMLDSKKALLVTLFFIFVPVMSLEIIGMAKAMVAELFFALTIFVMVKDIKYKWFLLPVLVIVTLVCHYTVGLVLIGLLFVCFIVSLVTKLIKRDFGFKRNVSLMALTITLALSTGLGYAYLHNAKSGGDILFTINNIAENITTKFSQYTYSMSHHLPATNPIPEEVSSSDTSISYIVNQSALVQVGLGIDFRTASPLGKIFRIVQYATQIMIVLGLIQLWRKRKEYKFTLEFMACMFGGFIIIASCIFIPYFANILNMTRFYHMSLFFLAPLFVLGCDLINKRWLVTSMLVVYFIFTSGFIYEATQNDRYDLLDMPYSYALSYERTGVAGVFNQDDLNCAEWLVEQELPVVCDMNTRRLMNGIMETSPRLYKSIYEPWIFQRLPEGEYYIFLDTWNIEHNSFVTNEVYGGYPAGLRLIEPLPIYVSGLPVAYQSGKAVVLIGGSDE